jgi:uncharacterized membrane protein
LAHLNKYLSQVDLDRIADAIGKAEETKIGEIRIGVIQKRTKAEQDLSLQELAVREFHRLGMEKTKERTGILLLILFDERRFHIVADTGIHTRVDDGTWQNIADQMVGQFKEGRYCDGISEAVAAMGRILARHFPKTPGNTNELSNTVDVR